MLDSLKRSFPKGVTLLYIENRNNIPLTDETGALAGLLGLGLGLRGECAEHPRHVASEGAHGLQALQILRGFALRAAVDTVPILGGDNGHVVDSEVLIQSVERSACPTASADGDGGCGLVGKERRARLEDPVEQGAEGAVGTRIIDGRADYDTVYTFLQGLTDGVVQGIGEATPAFGLAGTASDTAARGLVAEVDSNCVNTLRAKGVGYFLQSEGSVAVLMRGAV